jgi:aminoglycoside phosphotransferase family enzyme/predicted kinase
VARSEPTIQGRVREMVNPRLYGRGVKKVRMLQTHTSWVFLTGGHAYKVKKPVNFGFLDYTDLSAREFFCREEFRLNQRLSPDIYLRVRPITETRGRLRLDGRGRAIDWCLEMKELPQRAIMTEQLRQGRVTHEHLDEIARTIARFHAEAERGREISRYGSSEIVKLNWDENFAQTMEFRGRTITYPAFDLIKARVEDFIRRRRGLFRRRREAGFVRKCHGDLHSRNVFINGGVHIFDCIEFNPRFSCSDTASEIAFMKMDLDFHGRGDLAGFFIERYLAYTGDAGLLRLLDFYECYRAYVRGKVTSFNLNDPGMPAPDKAKARATARRYFKLSERSAARLERPARLVIMLGLPGTGKTWLAQRLADRIDAFHFNSDSVRKQLAGVPILSRRADNLDKNLYTRALGIRTYRELERRTRTFLKAGQTVIADATFLHPDSRARFRAIAEKAGVPWLFVQADCPEKTVLSRMRRRARQDGFSEADMGVYRRMKGTFEPPAPGPHLVRVDTRRPVNRSLARIERALLRL